MFKFLTILAALFMVESSFAQTEETDSINLDGVVTEIYQLPRAERQSLKLQNDPSPREDGVFLKLELVGRSTSFKTAIVLVPRALAKSMNLRPKQRVAFSANELNIVSSISSVMDIAYRVEVFPDFGERAAFRILNR